MKTIDGIDLLVASPLASRLEGIVLFGSQARGDATSSSDTDLLLCLKRGDFPNRELGDDWDSIAKAGNKRIPESVSPHFTVLPESPEKAEAIWLEIATDGIVLWDPRLEVTRFLDAVREYLSAGNAVRKSTYGRPYWVRPDCDKLQAEAPYRRACVRLRMLDGYFAEQSWADVVRESQEAVELALKGVLRSAGIESPRVHDVSQALLDNRDRLPPALLPRLERIASHSRHLRRDRELAYYGSEDLTPGEFYRREDAEAAREMAREVIEAAGIAFPR